MKLDKSQYATYTFFRQEIERINRVIAPLQAHIELTIKELQKQYPELDER